MLGNFLVLRKLSLLGDAISHAILPGLALGFLLSGSRNVLPMFVGAALFGLLTAFLSQLLSRLGKVDENASLGVVFTSLFALGVLLIRRAADSVDLDPGCVLYGALELVPFYEIEVFGFLVPRAVFVLFAVLLINLVFVLLFFKELTLVAFDSELASALGFNASRIHYATMFFVALTCVASFESVGSILVVAMLIIPAASARFLSNRITAMILCSLLLATLTTLASYFIAIEVNTSIAGMMAALSGLVFFLVALFAPEQGALAALLRQARLRLRITSEDVLGLTYRLEEKDYRDVFPVSARNIAAALDARFFPYLAIRRLTRKGFLEKGEEGVFSLTSRGREVARKLVRSHRLWESFLVKHLSLNKEIVHRTAMQLEHLEEPELEELLEESVGGESVDPHGREIP